MRNCAAMPSPGPSLFALALALATLAGCERRDDLDGRRRPIPGLDPAGAAGAASSRRQQVAFDAYDNRATALVHSGGSLIISGRGPGFATYSAGGAAAGWHLGAGAHPAARTDGQVAQLWFPYDRDPGGIAATGEAVRLHFRFRAAAKNQLASVFLNGAKVGDVEMPNLATSTYSVDVPASSLVPGLNHLRLFFRYAIAEDGARTAGSLEQLAIGAAPPVTGPPVVAAPVDRGGQRREALSLARGGRLSFFAQLPRARPGLGLAVAGDARAEIRVRSDDGETRRLWSGAAGKSWTEATVDLSEVAGELVRIDLIADGPIDWARPRVLSDPPDGVESGGGSVDHVIVWVVSGLRASAIEAAPALKALAARGISRVALSQTPAPGLSAHEIFAGVPGSAAEIPAERDTLAERFRRAGYTTTLVTGGPAVPGDAQGFERVHRLAPARAPDLWARAREILEKEVAARSLTVIWADDPALPWAPDPERLDASWRGYTSRVQPTATRGLSQSLRGGASALGARDRDYLRALYTGEVAAVDAAIATMTKDLEALGVADRSAVVVAGDRGQELFERGGFGEPTSLHREALEVPLVAVGPGRPAASPAAGDRVTLLADVYATALDAAQIPLPPELPARSVLAGPAPMRPAHLYLPGRARGLQWGSLKWLFRIGEIAALYDLEADPGESRGEPGERPVAARALSAWLGLALAFDERWDLQRWGWVTSLRPAFAAEHR
jgi:hypothetical protein